MCPEVACSGGYIGIDGARVAAKSQRQAFKFARFYSRERVAPGNLGDVESGFGGF